MLDVRRYINLMKRLIHVGTFIDEADRPVCRNKAEKTLALKFLINLA